MLLIILLLTIVAVISGLLSCCWAKDRFDYPGLIAIITAIIAYGLACILWRK